MDVNFRLLYEALCILKGRQLGTGIEYPCEEQHLKYFVQVVLVPVALLYLSAYLVQTQFVIHFLEKEISAIVTSLGILVNEGGRVELQHYLFSVLFFLGSELGNVLFGFSDGIFSPEALLQVLKSAEALYIFGGRLTVFVAVTLLNIIDGLLAH